MTVKRATGRVVSEAEFREWSRAWEAARRRAFGAMLVPLAVAAALGLTIPQLGMAAGVPRQWLGTGVFAAVGALLLLAMRLSSRRFEDAMSTLGRMCSQCETLIEDSRAVVKCGGKCPRCGTVIYERAA
jgi:hypothetical protein